MIVKTRGPVVVAIAPNMARVLGADPNARSRRRYAVAWAKQFDAWAVVGRYNAKLDGYPIMWGGVR